MEERDLAGRVAEQEQEIEFLKGEVARLRGLIASRADSLSDMLKRRGFRVFKKEQDEDVLGPPAGRRALSEEFYQRMKKYSFRLLLRDIIKHGSFTPEELVRYSSIEVVREYAAFLARARVLKALKKGGYSLANQEVTTFGPTLEWFVAELFRREFMADAMWGVRFKATSAGGDYDLLAAVEGKLLYAEVKSSPPKQIYDTEVRAYLDRSFELSPEISLFIVDTELRMKDKIVVLFEQVLPDTRLRGLPVERLKGELFHIDGRFFIINSKGSLVSNIGEALGFSLKRGADAA
jgi:hypothetical protein